MGYLIKNCVEQRGCDFTILSGKKVEALEFVRKKLLDEVNKKGNSYGADNYNHSYLYVLNSSIIQAKTIEKLLLTFGYNPEVDETGNIISVNFEGEKLGQEYYLFEAIASFVQPYSWIEMEDENRDIWRWIFEDNTCRQIYAAVIFP